MANKVDLLTSWVTIGKAGKTVDGRTITEDMLKQAASNYDPALYTAVIKDKHALDYSSSTRPASYQEPETRGTVRQLRNGRHADGSTTVEAILAPNARMLLQNAKKEKLFTSMELMPNFNGTPDYYLVGLAMTDEPASLGTTELHFSADNKSASLLTASEPIEFEAFKQETKISVKEQVMETLKSIPGLKKFFTNEKKDENEMTEEQLQTLLESNQQIIAAVQKFGQQTPPAAPTEEEPTLASLAATVKALEEKVAKFSAKTDPAPAAPTTKSDYSALQSEILKLTKKLDSALQGKPQTEVPPNTGGQKPYEVV